MLDVGAGVGGLSFELLAAGAERATAVEVAPAYLAAARDEANRRKLSHRLNLVSGDFVAIAGDIEPADVVAMDRVVCCYPACDVLLEAGARRSRRLFAFSYPRDRWYVRLVVTVQNLARALLRNPYRGFVHSRAAMEALLERQGFSRRQRHETLAWAADLYARRDDASSPRLGGR